LLNRAIVLSKIMGAEKGLHELELIKNEPQIKSYHLFYSTQAEFFIELGEHEMAIRSFLDAAELAPLE
jgi:predicted RNA polymerase sigma factor